MRVVISQPMYFPWLGQLNQALLADAFVFYSDVQFARGFINRVQILIDGQQELITVPTLGSKRSLINQLKIDYSQQWQKKHLAKIKQSFANALFKSQACSFFHQLVNKGHENLSQLSSSTVISLCEELFPEQCPMFFDSADFPRQSKRTDSLLHICKELGATKYLTGHGAANYILVEQFDKAGIELEFIDYHIVTYPQLGGKHITPYVSSLDAFARLGSEKVIDLLKSGTIIANEFGRLTL